MNMESEAAATRRRWINLAEIVGIVGLIIGGLSLWMTWHDRKVDQAEQAAREVKTEKVQSLVTLRATASKDGERLDLSDPAHDVQKIDVAFPKALGVSAQEALLSPRIQASWFADALLTATDKGPDAQTGRLPVLVTAYYWDGDTQQKSAAIYDLVWKSEGRFLRGRALHLQGMMLRSRSATGLDGMWKKP